MGISWTKEQQDAIDSRQGTVLVSAAAGSGKTAVLVERVIRRLTDKDNPCSTDNLLIVTFTKAATAQMKERIGAAILKKLAENPTDSHLRRQYMMLPFAKICTIDAFCGDLVRENFHELSISPDYTVLDNENVKIMKNEAVDAVLSREYDKKDEAFFELSNLVSTGSSDNSLSELIKKLYEISMSYPFPEEFLDSLLEEYRNTDINSSKFGAIIKDYLFDMLDYCIDESENLLNVIETEDELQKAYSQAIESDVELCKSMKETLKNDWDSALLSFEKPNFKALGRVPKGYDSENKRLTKTVRDKVKTLIKKAADIMCITAQEHEEDMLSLVKPIESLISLVKAFDEQYSKMKRLENAADFSDILHWALDLLIRKNGDKLEKTKLSQELSKRYAEILVDEYQDINEAQDMIFKAVSRNEENLFMVGDVKQSIYRFRQAMPEIFLRRRASMQDYENGNYPARILLSKNFRSRNGVTSAVNYIFRQIMSPSSGELLYDDSEALCAGADYPQRDMPDAELHIVDVTNCSDSPVRAQAKYVARYIKNAVESGMQVTKGGQLKPAQYGDFCILLRSAKNVSEEFAQALNNEHIPVFSPSTGGFFEATEISFALSLLKVLDNPVQDIPLAAVMMSPVFGFSADEIAQFRASRKEYKKEHGREPLYMSVKAQEEGNPKVKKFFKRLTELRRLSLTLSTGELVRRVVDETGFMAIAGAMPDGDRRKLNLELLSDYANKYEASGNLGLSGFIRFIDKIARTDSDLASASRPSEDANVVRIMTVHQSKGLEFPICILADMQHKFNERDNNSSVIITSYAGIGIKRRAKDNVSLYDTAGRQAAKIMSEKMGRSEEMRVLYVALTRAKENLVMVTSLANPEKKLSALGAFAGHKKTISPFAVMNMTSFCDFIISALIRHPNAGELRRAADISLDVYSSKIDDFKLKAVISKPVEDCENEKEEVIEQSADAQILREIEKRLNYVDPKAKLAGVAAKRAASHSSQSGIDRTYFASQRPAFMGKGGLTPAQRGTATHKFMQFSNYEQASMDAKKELERLVSMGFLSPLEGGGVNLAAIKRFFGSSLYKRMSKASNVMREKKFTILMPLSVLDSDVDDAIKDEKTVVQGIADCVFIEDDELVIVDYKTDMNVSQEELISRYKPQLDIYKRALGECLNMRVKQALIYSFYLSKTIEVL